MKESKYNIFFEHKGKKLAFNSMTCVFAEVNEKFFNLLALIKNKQFEKTTLDDENLNLLKDMEEGGFVIDDCFNEIDFLKFKSYQGKFKTNSFGLTIAPTFSCNFACPYCYEHTKNEFMSQEVMDAIYKEIHSAAEAKKQIRVTWYGGEPLLAKNIIWKLSEQFLKDVKTFGTTYSAGIITNGYLIDDETIENFKKYNIIRVQITIDGPPDIHNSRRKLKNTLKPTFETILRNAKKTVDAGIHVDIRINIDKTNEERVEELLDILLDYHLENALVYLGHVESATDFCQSISGTCLSTKDYAKKYVNFERLLIKKGFNPAYYPQYPRAKSNSCGADSINAKVIAPDGSLYKCWHDMSYPDKSIGNIKEPNNLTGKNIMTEVNYMLFSPLKNEKCNECKVLPLCMGGCPTVSNVVECQKWKYSLLETLKTKYDVLLSCPKF